MSRQKTPTLTPTESIAKYFGDIFKMFNPLPYRCNVCGDNFTKFKEKNFPIMNVAGMYFHIRKAHNERIKTIVDGMGDDQ